MVKPSARKRFSLASQPLSGVERQRLYRLARELVSIDVSRQTASLVQALRTRTGLTTDQVIAAAAEALVSTLTKKARRPRLSSNSASGARRSLVTETVANEVPSKRSADQRVKARPMSSPGDDPARNIDGARDAAKNAPQPASRRGSAKTNADRSSRQGDLNLG